LQYKTGLLFFDDIDKIDKIDEIISIDHYRKQVTKTFLEIITVYNAVSNQMLCCCSCCKAVTPPGGWLGNP
jgi:hypothetical protein